MPCFFTLAPCSRPLVPGGMTKAAWPREPSSRSTEAITTWTLAIPPLVAQAFWPLITHSSLRLVVLGGGAVARDVRAGVRLRRAEGPDLDVVLVAEALRHPLDHLLGRARAVDPGDRQRGAEDRHADPGVAPEELLVDEREGQPRRIGPELGDRLEAVEPDLGRLLHDRPGELLLLVPLVRRGPHRLLGEPVRPLPDVLLVLGELERERACPRPRSRGSRWPQPQRPSPRPPGRPEPAPAARSPSSPGSPWRLTSSSSSVESRC